MVGNPPCRRVVIGQGLRGSFEVCHDVERLAVLQDDEAKMELKGSGRDEGLLSIFVVRLKGVTQMGVR